MNAQGLRGRLATAKFEWLLAAMGGPVGRLCRRLVLLAFVTLSPWAAAQEGVNCTGTHAACMAACKVGDALGSVFGRAERKDIARECQAKCDQERGQCQQMRAPGTAPAPGSDSSAAPAPRAPTQVQPAAGAAPVGGCLKLVETQAASPANKSQQRLRFNNTCAHEMHLLVRNGSVCAAEKFAVGADYWFTDTRANGEPVTACRNVRKETTRACGCPPGQALALPPELLGAANAVEAKTPNAAECSGDESRCFGACNREGNDRSRGTAAQRGAHVTQCRAACNEQARTCAGRAEAVASATVRNAPPTAVRVPDAPTGHAPGVVLPALGDSAPAPAPAARSAVAAAVVAEGRVVLITRATKDPLSSIIPVSYVEEAVSLQDARRLMRKGWAGPVPTRNRGAESLLRSVNHGVMTRESLVEETLRRFEQAGHSVPRSELRVDVLGDALVAVAAPVAVPPQDPNLGLRPSLAGSDKCLHVQVDDGGLHLLITNLCREERALMVVVRHRGGACTVRNIEQKTIGVSLAKSEVAAFCRRTGGATPETVSSAQCSCFAGTTPITTAALPGMR